MIRSPNNCTVIAHCILRPINFFLFSFTVIVAVRSFLYSFLHTSFGALHASHPRNFLLSLFFVPSISVQCTQHSMIAVIRLLCTIQRVRESKTQHLCLQCIRYYSRPIHMQMQVIPIEIDHNSVVILCTNLKLMAQAKCMN